jgi:hypothetical protein
MREALLSRRGKRGGRTVSREASLSAEALAASASTADLHVESLPALEARIAPHFQELSLDRLFRIAQGRPVDFPGRAEFERADPEAIQVMAKHHYERRQWEEREALTRRRELFVTLLSAIGGAAAGSLITILLQWLLLPPAG